MFSLTSTRKVKLVDSNTMDSNGCILGSISMEITLFFYVNSVTIENGRAYALLSTGMDKSEINSTYGRYNVTIEAASSDDAITQAEGQIMTRDEFLGAIVI